MRGLDSVRCQPRLTCSAPTLPCHVSCGPRCMGITRRLPVYPQQKAVQRFLHKSFPVLFLVFSISTWVTLGRSGSHSSLRGSYLNHYHGSSIYVAIINNLHPLIFQCQLSFTSALPANFNPLTPTGFLVSWRLMLHCLWSRRLVPHPFPTLPSLLSNLGWSVHFHKHVGRHCQLVEVTVYHGLEAFSKLGNMEIPSLPSRVSCSLPSLIWRLSPGSGCLIYLRDDPRHRSLKILFPS